MAGQEVRRVNSFEEFETATLEFSRQNISEEFPGTFSQVLYRGHADSCWKLATTLDRFIARFGGKDIGVSVSDYYRILLKIYPAFASHTGMRFDLPQPNSTAYREAMDKTFLHLLGYEFLVYLRHMGFPSPLLDWTRSPYVAAFFAFNNATEDRDVSIYCFQDRVGAAKGSWLGDPEIVEHGPYIVTHDRHFSQQAAYTTCTRRDQDEIHYISHEVADFGNDQDILLKIDVPGSERSVVMKKLDQMNVNMFTLFGSIDSLSDMLAYRELEQFLQYKREQQNSSILNLAPIIL